MDIHQKLAAMSLPKSLAIAHQRKDSGALIVRAGELTKNIFLNEGSVIFASSNDRNDRLGEMLVRRGVVSVCDFLEASSMVVPGKRFGTVLIEMGLLSPEQLVWAVKEQVKEIIFSLFGELFVTYRFEPAAHAGDEVITLNINTPELIRQGILSMDRISWALSDFENLHGDLVLSRSPESILNVLSLSKLEQEIVLFLKQPREFVSVFTGHPPSLHSSIVKFMWTLYILGYVEVVRDKGGDQPAQEVLDVTFDDLSGI